jgi:hypothetical protein
MSYRDVIFREPLGWGRPLFQGVAGFSGLDVAGSLEIRVDPGGVACYDGCIRST